MKSVIAGVMLGLGILASPTFAQQVAQSTAAGSQQGLSVSAAFARATPPRAPVAGAFLTITNQSGRDDRLVGAFAPSIAEKVLVHEMAVNNGVMTMRALDEGLPVKAGAVVRLAPGGLHLMLMGLKQTLQEGQTIEIILRFEHAGDIRAQFDILARNASSAPAHAPGQGIDHSNLHGNEASQWPAGAEARMHMRASPPLTV